jgi:hypothetical protein
MSGRFDRVRLVPLVEAYTGILDGQSGGPLSEKRSDAFYRKQLVTAGLPAPIDGHPWLVRAGDLRAGPALARLVRAVLDRDCDEEPSLIDRLQNPITREDTLEEIPAMAGGYALEASGECLVLPGCCADLGNLDDWQQATRHQGCDPAMLWIGHPWLLVSADGALLTLTGPVDDAVVGTGPEVGQIHRDVLRDAVITAAGERARYAAVLRTVCAELIGPEAAVEVTMRLMGGAD